jgi:CRP/FNR family transcriptional regulator, cyclic AMP receptor protein
MSVRRPQAESLIVDRSRHVALLGADADLRGAVPPADLVVAQRLVVAPAVELDAGTWTADSLGASRGAFAALIVRGLVTREITIGGRRSADLLGPGDVFHPWRTPPTAVGGASRWASGTTVLVAMLDERFVAAARRWPGLFDVVHDRLAEQLERAAARAAIMALPRVEERVVGLFWQLAERWGKVRVDGVVVELALTHELIGQLIGAQRPTVSLALAALDRDGALRRTREGSWLLTARSREMLPAVHSVAPVHTATPTAAPSRDGGPSAPVTPIATRRAG